MAPFNLKLGQPCSSVMDRSMPTRRCQPFVLMPVAMFAQAVEQRLDPGRVFSPEPVLQLGDLLRGEAPHLLLAQQEEKLGGLLELLDRILRGR